MSSHSQSAPEDFPRGLTGSIQASQECVALSLCASESLRSFELSFEVCGALFQCYYSMNLGVTNT